MSRTHHSPSPSLAGFTADKPAEMQSIVENSLLFEHPHPVPVIGRRALAELQHAGEHDAARRILRVDREGGLKSAHGLIPGAAPIGGEGRRVCRAQLALPRGEVALAAEQLE